MFTFIIHSFEADWFLVANQKLDSFGGTFWYIYRSDTKAYMTVCMCGESGLVG